MITRSCIEASGLGGRITPRPVLRRGDGRIRDLEALLPGRVDRHQRDETLAVSCFEFGQGVRKGRADSGDRRAQAHQATMLVVLTVLDAMQARLRDGRHFEWPTELLGVVGDDDLEAVGLGLAYSSMSFVPVQPLRSWTWTTSWAFSRMHMISAMGRGTFSSSSSFKRRPAGARCCHSCRRTR